MNDVDMRIFGDRPLSGERHGDRFRIFPAAHAAGKVVVEAKAIKSDGMKGRAQALAEALGGVWVHRYSGYLLTPARAVNWLDLHAAGVDARLRYFAADRTKGLFRFQGRSDLTLEQVRRLLNPEPTADLPGLVLSQ
jgi:hypothetical protein